MPFYSATEDVPDLTGKVIIVTGANSGLGFEATRAFLRKGATVVMACRNPKKAQAAIEELDLDETLPTGSTSNAQFMRLDLADLKSVRQFVAEFTASFQELHVLLNNAGLMQGKKRMTVDGLETTVGVNHFAPYVLTSLLLPVLEKTAGSRIVSVASMGHKYPGFDIEDLMFDKADREYGSFSAYCYSKLCNVLFGFELAKRLKASGSSVMSVVCHPGLTFTPIQQGSFATWLGSTVGMNVDQGALSLIYAAVNPSVIAGQYIGPDGFLGVRGMPTVSGTTAQAADSKLQNRLWELSEELTGVVYDFPKRASSSKKVSTRASNRKSGEKSSAVKTETKRVSSKRGSVRA